MPNPIARCVFLVVDSRKTQPIRKTTRWVVVDIEGLLGRQILSYSSRYQESLVEAARNHWRARGFPYPKITATDILREIRNLVASDKLVNGRACGLLSTV